MRVVLDTNVLIAAFIARGVCHEVFERVVEDHQLILSPFLLEEFERTMAGKLAFEQERVERALALLNRVGQVLSPQELENPVSRDRSDDAVLALAVAANATCLITGDDDLLVLEHFDGIPIISPRDFLSFIPPEVGS